MSRVITITDTVIEEPAVPAMTVAFAKKHLKALTGAEDVLVLSWIYGAIQFFEEQTGRQIITATREAWLDAFPDCRGRIELPKPPLQEVLSVAYVGSDGTLIESFDDGGSPATLLYAVKAPQGSHAERGWIEPLYGVAWPTPRCESGAVRIRYRCGYGDSEEDVPPLITGILATMIGSNDQFRAGLLLPPAGAPVELPYLTTMLNGFKYSAFPSVQMRTSLPWV